MSDDLKYLLGDTDNDDGPEQNLEKYLEKQEQAWKPTSELKLSPKTMEEAQLTAPPEKPRTLEIKENEAKANLSGNAKYLVEGIDPSEGIIVNAKWIEVCNESAIMAVTQARDGKMKLEDIIAHIYKLEELRFFIPAKQRGLRNALEHLLGLESEERRKALLELDIKTRAARSKKVVEKSVKARKSPTVQASTKAIKAIAALKNVGFEKESIEKRLRTLGFWDEKARTYLDETFSGEERSASKGEES